MKRFNIFAGNFGSGKTELVLNFAVNAADSGKKVMLVDMDLINPYFKSSSQISMLHSKGIEVVSPGFANTLSDTPSLSPKIYSAFTSGCDVVIFDSGGDPDGATVLGFLEEKFKENIDDLDFFMVLNTRRPMQGTPKDIVDLLGDIEDASRLKITGLINNTNLSRETDAQVIEQSREVVKTVSNLTGIPVRYTSVLQELCNAGGFGIDGELMPIKLYLRPEWMDLI